MSSASTSKQMAKFGDTAGRPRTIADMPEMVKSTPGEPRAVLDAARPDGVDFHAGSTPAQTELDIKAL